MHDVPSKDGHNDPKSVMKQQTSTSRQNDNESTESFTFKWQNMMKFLPLECAFFLLFKGKISWVVITCTAVRAATIAGDPNP